MRGRPKGVKKATGLGDARDEKEERKNAMLLGTEASYTSSSRDSLISPTNLEILRIFQSGNYLEDLVRGILWNKKSLSNSA